MPTRAPLTIDRILAWADAFRERTGRWPHASDGRVGLLDTTWNGVDQALMKGHRGLPGGSSLALVLHAHRGQRHPRRLPPLTDDTILAWADAHHRRTGDWPVATSGPIPGAPGETWLRVETALRNGVRGQPGGTSLARLLAARRGARNPAALPRLARARVLAWADAHRARTGRLPTYSSGPIPDTPGEVWSGVDRALAHGTRGFPGGDSLARFLARYRGTGAARPRGRLTPDQILGWADAHHARTGRWPAYTSGRIPGAPGERWSGVDAALTTGTRGLPGGDALASFLARHRGASGRTPGGRLTPGQILAWADAHRARTGDWPGRDAGPIPGAPGETWSAVESALRRGGRGLPGGDSLAQFLARRRRARNPKGLPALTPDRILSWADAHHARTGRWPTRTSGPIPGAPGETWFAVEGALAVGARGLPGGSSLAQLLATGRGVRNRKALPALTVDQIRGWVAAHHRRTGGWPGPTSGPIPEAPGETWSAVSNGLKRGSRGLPRGASLAAVVRACRGERT